MATVVISDAAQARAEELVRRGRFASIDAAVEEALQCLGDRDEEVDLDDLSPEDRAAVEEGLADIKAGRTIPIQQVRHEMHARFGNLRA